VTDLPADLDLAALEALAVEVAVETAALIERRPDDLGVDTKSTDTDVVTVMDTRAQRHIADRLRAARPDDGFHGEESGDQHAGTSGLTWVVDPIDGTVNYLYGIPMYAVSVAVVTGDPRTPGAWRPLAGAVANGRTGEVWSARLGGGAWLRVGGGEPRRLRVTDRADLGLALIGTGFSYDATVRELQARVLTVLLPRIRDIRRAGSAALDLCQVATGRLDGYFERRLNAWDVAAGWLVATEAGAVLGGAGGVDAPHPDLTWASGPGLAAALTEALDDAHRETGDPLRVHRTGE
jgi:myo-inositol-1(or 4)-monophosphatase